MKNKSLNLILKVTAVFALISFVLIACKKDDPATEDPIASFQYEVSASNFLEVTFTNYSQNATSYLWDFGDGETSTESDPVHTFAESGTYTVMLTASNADGASHDFSESITITDPDDAYKLLTGDVSKTWKLYREGTSMSLGASPTEPGSIWPGLQNDGSRPCLYNHEFTFHFDGTYEFNDNGWFWAEYGVFNNVEGCDQNTTPEACIEAIPANMINECGDDVSDWLSGTHSFTYDVSGGTATLTGQGAWIGICKLTTAGETIIPVASTTFDIAITTHTGYDLMQVSYNYGSAYWEIWYVNYSDPALEPELVTEEEPFGEDLPDLTPTEMYNTFETDMSYVLLDTAAVYPGTGLAANGMTFTMGVADPDGGGTNVGEYIRWGEYQELQFMQENDIQFDNFTTVSLDVYMPSSNDYTGSLTKGVAIIIGEASQTEQWWTGHTQYDATVDDMDQWVTLTFNLDSPTGGLMYNPLDRTDLDFFAISIGGGGHFDGGTFYVRNFIFE